MIGFLKNQCTQIGRMKFGFEIPGTFEQSVSLEENNGNSICQDYIDKEMNNSRIAFKLLKRHRKPTVGYTKIIIRFLFELKLDMDRKY